MKSYRNNFMGLTTQRKFCVVVANHCNTGACNEKCKKNHTILLFFYKVYIGINISISNKGISRVIATIENLSVFVAKGQKNRRNLLESNTLDKNHINFCCVVISGSAKNASNHPSIAWQATLVEPARRLARGVTPPGTGLLACQTSDAQKSQLLSPLASPATNGGAMTLRRVYDRIRQDYFLCVLGDRFSARSTFSARLLACQSSMRLVAASIKTWLANSASDLSSIAAAILACLTASASALIDTSFVLFTGRGSANRAGIWNILKLGEIKSNARTSLTTITNITKNTFEVKHQFLLSVN